MTDISIIIVNYRGWRRLTQCLDSLKAISNNLYFFEVLIVDNRSEDGLLESFIISYPEFTFISNTGNLGFASGCNLGARHSSGSYLLFLNPDTIIAESALHGLLQEVRSRNQFSIVSCNQIREDGSQEKPFGSFPSIFTLTGWMRAISRVLSAQKIPFTETNEYVFPDWISGSVVMISKKTFYALNGWDEDFWMYFEDVDLCRRARLKGGEVVLMKSICIEHNHGGASRINQNIKALTKTEVNISRHVYISKHDLGIRASLMHIILIINSLLFGFIPAIAGIVFFFVKSLRTLSRIYIRLLQYYAIALRRGTWISKRSVNFPER